MLYYMICYVYVWHDVLCIILVKFENVLCIGTQTI
jgi:hypothetical protein